RPEGMSDTFQRYSAYYDLLYRDKNYVAEADYIAQILRTSRSNVQTLLEFGSGTGRHGRLLAQRGFQVLGIERSETMIKAALDRASEPSDCAPGNFECKEGEIRTIRLSRTFDAVTALFHVVSYQT